MKLRIACLFLVAILPVMANAATLSGTFPYTFAGSTVCSSTVTSNCLDHFEVGVLVGTAFNTVVTVPIPASAVSGTSATGGPVIVTVPPFTFNIAFGQTQLAVIVVAKDGVGNRVTSDPSKSMEVLTVIPSAPGPPSLNQQ